MVKKSFGGAIAPYSVVEIPRTPNKQAKWQDNLLYLNRQKSYSYCSLNYKDDLTQIANKSYFNIWLEQVWKRLVKEQGSLSIILIEVDYYKIYHKTRGKQAGEHCLQQIAKVISDRVQPPDGLAARFGEEKFALIIPEITVGRAFKIAEKIRKNVKRLAFYHDAQIDGLPARVVTVSLGIGIGMGQIEVSPSILIDTAEEALYQSYRKGRDRTEVKCIVGCS